MAVQRQVGSQTDCKESAVDLRGKESFLCTRDATGKVTLAGNGGKVAGVISEGKNVGLHTSFNTGNQLKAVAGVAIKPMDKLASDANGKVKVAAVGNFVFATAISVAAAGEMVEFDLSHEGALTA